MKGKAIITILIIIAIIIIVPIFFRPKDAVAPVKNEENAQKDETILGNTNDLIYFSIKPGQEVSGFTKVTGEIKGGYFFEGNILLSLLDSDKKMMRPGHANATTDWMTAGPVSFEGDIDFTGMYRGKAYIEIHNDNASGLPEHDKSILIPIIIN